MNTQEALRSTMDMSLQVLTTYVSDLSDAELVRRPDPGCNHLAWQLGHLINSEVQLLNAVCPGKAAPLPEGFAAQHSQETAASDDPAQFRSRQEYVDLFQQVRAATQAALATLSDQALDQPSPEGLRERFPTVGSVFTLIGIHPMMHAGQFVVVRRQLGKPVLI